MKFDLEGNAKRIQRMKLIIYPLVTILLGLFQISIINFIEIGGISPNLMIILIVWIAINEGQFIALFSGFLVGIFYDFLKMDVIGTNALALVITAFVSGFFHKPGKQDLIIRSFKFLLIVLISSIAHNLVYFLLYIRVSEISFWNFFLKYGIATSFYTTVFSFFPIFISFKRRSLNI